MRTVCYLTLFCLASLAGAQDMVPVAGSRGGNTEGNAAVRFEDDFGGDLTGWRLVGEPAIVLRDSGDPAHGRVMELQATGNVHALVEDSGNWGPVRVEGEMLFPTDDHSYLGLIYNYQASATRADFGEVYVKGNGSYLRVNPWRDGNASRLLYEEYKTPLTLDDAIRIGEWKRFKTEVSGNVFHVYIGDMSVPKLTLDLFELDSGLVGFQPRIVGGPVWIDNIKVTSIESLTYDGPDLPGTVYEPQELVTDWQVIGPLAEPSLTIERSDDAAVSTVDGYAWRPFATDRRGAVISGRVTEYHGRPVAYFRTVIHAEDEETAVLHFSTTDEIAHWVNGRFQGFIYRDGYISRENDWNAWFDFWKNPEHAGRSLPIELRPGANQLILRVRNGNFASGGFFVRLERTPE